MGEKYINKEKKIGAWCLHGSFQWLQAVALTYQRLPQAAILEERGLMDWNEQTRTWFDLSKLAEIVRVLNG